jgi:hypothetical protein
VDVGGRSLVGRLCGGHGVWMVAVSNARDDAQWIVRARRVVTLAWV